MPAVLSVRSGYEYYAIDTDSPYGAVVYGCEPEFEEAKKVSDSFIEFLELIMRREIVL